MSHWEKETKTLCLYKKQWWTNSDALGLFWLLRAIGGPQAILVVASDLQQLLLTAQAGWGLHTHPLGAYEIVFWSDPEFIIE